MNMQSLISVETTNNGKTDKVSRYKWKLKDSPGTFKYISKHDLRIADEYQRELIETKVLDISADWSWFGCGALVVAIRNFEYWVVDGQHRFRASLNRSDIQTLPCMVFDTYDVVEEAKAFLTLNTGRKPVTAIGKLKALAASNDENSEFVVNAIKNAGLVISKTCTNGTQIKCISVCQRLAKEGRDTFVRSLKLCSELSAVSNVPVLERVLAALYYIDKNTVEGIEDKRMRARIKSIGSDGLYAAASRASAYYAHGGMKVWADGVLAALNKGVQNKFEFINGE